MADVLVAHVLSVAFGLVRPDFCAGVECPCRRIEPAFLRGAKRGLLGGRGLVGLRRLVRIVVGILVLVRDVVGVRFPILIRRAVILSVLRKVSPAAGSSGIRRVLVVRIRHPESDSGVKLNAPNTQASAVLYKA